MSRYSQGTKPGHTPVDYDHIIRTRLGKLGIPMNSRQMMCAEQLVRRTITTPSAISYAQESGFWFRWCRDRGLDPMKVSARDVDQFRASNGGYAMGTQHLKLMVVRLLFATVIPRSIRRQPETHTPALSKEQCEQFLSGIAADLAVPTISLTAKRDLALASTMVRLCLRTSETGALCWGRISYSAGQRQIAFVGKGRKPAHLPVPEDVWRMLVAWKDAFERDTGTTLGPADPIFVDVSTRGLVAARTRGRGRSPLAHLSRSHIYKILNSRLRDVGIVGERYAGHCLRATGACLSIEGGSTLIEVQQLLRHSSINTTMVYLQKLTLGAVRRAVDNIQLAIPKWDQETEPLRAS